MKNWMHAPLIAASLLVGMSGATFAQSTASTAQDPVAGMSAPKSGMQEHMHDRIVTRHVKHMSELKAKLKLDAQQESAWKTFMEAMQPPAIDVGRPDHTAMAKLTTPERVDQMEAWHARMEGEMKKRGDAAKRFYAILNAEQKKVLDAETSRFMAGGKDHHMNHPH